MFKQRIELAIQSTQINTLSTCKSGTASKDDDEETDDDEISEFENGKKWCHV